MSELVVVCPVNSRSQCLYPCWVFFVCLYVWFIYFIFVCSQVQKHVRLKPTFIVAQLRKLTKNLRILTSFLYHFFISFCCHLYNKNLLYLLLSCQSSNINTNTIFGRSALLEVKWLCFDWFWWFIDNNLIGVTVEKSGWEKHESGGSKYSQKWRRIRDSSDEKSPVNNDKESFASIWASSRTNEPYWYHIL